MDEHVVLLLFISQHKTEILEFSNRKVIHSDGFILIWRLIHLHNKDKIVNAIFLWEYLNIE